MVSQVFGNGRDFVFARGADLRGGVRGRGGGDGRGRGGGRGRGRGRGGGGGGGTCVSLSVSSCTHDSQKLLRRGGVGGLRWGEGRGRGGGDEPDEAAASPTACVLKQDFGFKVRGTYRLLLRK